jgi:hypothetical protein
VVVAAVAVEVAAAVDLAVVAAEILIRPNSSSG